MAEAVAAGWADLADRDTAPEVRGQVLALAEELAQGERAVVRAERVLAEAAAKEQVRARAELVALGAVEQAQVERTAACGVPVQGRAAEQARAEGEARAVPAGAEEVDLEAVVRVEGPGVAKVRAQVWPEVGAEAVEVGEPGAEEAELARPEDG